MTLIRQVRLLFWRKMLETLRAPIWVFTGLATPLLYLGLFAPLLKPLSNGPGFMRGDVLDVFVPGILVLMAWGAGMGEGWLVIAELQNGVLERLRVTPTSRMALVLGPALRDVVMLVLPALLVIAAATPFGYRPHWPGIGLLLLLLSLLTVLISVASNCLGVLLQDIGTLAAVVTGLQLPLTLLSGILLPLSLGPPWMRAIGHLNPLYYAVTAARSLSAGALESANVGYAFLVLGVLLILVTFWSSSVYRKALS